MRGLWEPSVRWFPPSICRPPPVSTTVTVERLNGEPCFPLCTSVRNHISSRNRVLLSWWTNNKTHYMYPMTKNTFLRISSAVWNSWQPHDVRCHVPEKPFKRSGAGLSPTQRPPVLAYSGRGSAGSLLPHWPAIWEQPYWLTSLLSHFWDRADHVLEKKKKKQSHFKQQWRFCDSDWRG